MSNPNRNTENFDYDVCLSFAGEDREYVENVANELRGLGIRVFYDRYEQIELWGKDLYTHLDDVYKNAARYCVMFVSCHYSNKLWTNHERQSAQARALKENIEYVLPARFDNTDIPGLRDTVGYIDLRKNNPIQLANMIRQKVGKRQTQNYLPPVPDYLFNALGAENDVEQDQIFGHANRFLSVLRRMTPDERHVIFQFIIHACPAELPENIHVNIDLLRRYTGFTVQRLKRILGNLQSLGFFTSIREDDETCDQNFGKSQMFVLEWNDMNVETGDNATDIACEMIIGAIRDYCEECGFQALQRLDFSQLASATKVIEEH
jgi:hypothetical protein